MHNKKCAIFSAPASSGKDDAIKYIMSRTWTKTVKTDIIECKGILHELCMTLFGVPKDRYYEIYNDRSIKETPLPEFRLTTTFNERLVLSNVVGFISPVDSEREFTGLEDGRESFNLSIREALIYTSEVLVKPRFGADFFGKSRALAVQQSDATLIFDGSYGFEEEVKDLIDVVGQENILAIRVHRPGYTFDGDSRSYIEDGIIDNIIDIDNNGTLEEYLIKVNRVVEDFYAGV